MDDRQALASFAALSQETRLRIIRTLVVAGAEGLSAGSIAEQVGVSPSNLSFHLKELDHAGLIDQRREARSIYYSASYDTLADLVRFLMEDCCSGQLSLRNPVRQSESCCGDQSVA